jgi:hypothetical protein
MPDINTIPPNERLLRAFPRDWVGVRQGAIKLDVPENLNATEERKVPFLRNFIQCLTADIKLRCI